MLLSIIIPVYNVESYLRRCIDSVIVQGIDDDVELLLIDDGSKDSSGEICDEYASKYDWIHVFHIPNGGVGNARNYGIDRASGEYLMFIDSDDFLEQGMYQSIKTALETHSADCYIYGYKSYPNGCDGHCLPTGFYSEQEELANLYVKLKRNYLLFTPINKLFRADIVNMNKIRFDNQLHYYEDYLFNLSYFRFVRSVYTIGGIFYNYVQHEGGRLSGKYTPASVRIRVTEDIKDMSALLPSNAESREYDMMEYYNGLLNCVDSEVQHAQNYKTVFCCIDYLLVQITQYGFYEDFKRFIGRRKYVFLLRNRYSIFVLLMFKKCLLSIIRR